MANPLNVVGRAHQAAGGPGFTWFVYGSSLDTEAFAGWARDHGYRVPDFSAARPARLRGWRLAFDAPSRMWGGPVASLTEAPGDAVEGLAVPMPGEAARPRRPQGGRGLGALRARRGDARDRRRTRCRRWPSGWRRRAGSPPMDLPRPPYLDVMLRGARASRAVAGLDRAGSRPCGEGHLAGAERGHDLREAARWPSPGRRSRDGCAPPARRTGSPPGSRRPAPRRP